METLFCSFQHDTQLLQKNDPGIFPYSQNSELRQINVKDEDPYSALYCHGNSTIEANCFCKAEINQIHPNEFWLQEGYFPLSGDLVCSLEVCHLAPGYGTTLELQRGNLLLCSYSRRDWTVLPSNVIVSENDFEVNKLSSSTEIDISCLPEHACACSCRHPHPRPICTQRVQALLLSRLSIFTNLPFC